MKKFKSGNLAQIGHILKFCRPNNSSLSQWEQLSGMAEVNTRIELTDMSSDNLYWASCFLSLVRRGPIMKMTESAKTTRSNSPYSFGGSIKRRSSSHLICDLFDPRPAGRPVYRDSGNHIWSISKREDTTFPLSSTFRQNSCKWSDTFGRDFHLAGVGWEVGWQVWREAEWDVGRRGRYGHYKKGRRRETNTRRVIV